MGWRTNFINASSSFVLHQHKQTRFITSCLAAVAAAAETGGRSGGSLDNAVAVAQLDGLADTLLGLVASEASFLDELLLKDTVLPDIVLDLHCKSKRSQTKLVSILLCLWDTGVDLLVVGIQHSQVVWAHVPSNIC